VVITEGLLDALAEVVASGSSGHRIIGCRERPCQHGRHRGQAIPRHDSIRTVTPRSLPRTRCGEAAGDAASVDPRAG
jgi:hypothetical protein